MHLTGLEPFGKNGRSIKPTKFLHDFANGGELAYDDILIDKFLFVFTQLILHYPYIPLPSGIVYKFIFSEKNLNNLCYYFNSQAVWTIKY